MNTYSAKTRQVVVRLVTDRFAPANVTTLACNEAVKGAMVRGEYDVDAWHFDLLLNPTCERATVSFQVNNSITIEEQQILGAAEAAILDPGKQTKTVRVFLHSERIPEGANVTLHCNDLNEDKTIPGQREGNTWKFTLVLPKTVKTTVIGIKRDDQADKRVRLDPIALDFDTHIYEFVANDQVEVPEEKLRQRHYIDRLLTEDNDFHRSYIPSNLDETITYDVIVIGSGMGGGIVADALSDRGCNVLVLEGGSIHQPQNIVNVPVRNVTRTAVSFENAPGSTLTKDICMNFGGRSVYWSALIPRMRTWELEKYWPPDIKEYLTKEGGGYDQAETLFRKRTEYNEFLRGLKRKVEAKFSDFYVDHTPRSYHSLGSSAPRRKGWPDEIPTGTFSTAALLLNSLSHDGLYGRDHLTINLNHLVTKIEPQAGGPTSVLCRDLLYDCDRCYKAHYVILAAGVTESPSLVKVSGLTNRKNVGIGLTDHQVAELVFVMPPDSPLFSSNDQAKFLLRPKMASDTEHMYSCELALNWKFWDNRDEDDDIFEGQFPPGAPIQSTIKFSFGKELDDGNWIEPAPYGRGKHIVHVAPMLDRPFFKEVTALKDQVLDFFGVTDPESRARDLQYRKDAESYHSGGTLRIGDERDDRAVVDQDLHLIGCEKIFCCDLSIFPYISSANPSLTLGALALRLADHIAKLAGKCQPPDQRQVQR